MGSFARSKRGVRVQAGEGVPMEEVEAVVVGSGVSGSSLAFHLKQSGVNVVCAEANSRVGGNLISKKNEEGFQWEEGPNTFQPTPQIMRFAHDLGIANDLVFANPTLPRLVFWDDKLWPLPMKPQDAVFNFGLISWPGKIRAGLGAMGIPPFYQPPPEGKEESIEEFVTRHLGEETFTKVIDPFVSGVYAGDPKKLAIRGALKKIYALEQLSFNGGFIPGAAVRIKQKKEEEDSEQFKKEWREGVDLMPPGGALGSFRDGLIQMAEATEKALNQDGQNRMRVGWKLKEIEKDDQGMYTALFDTPSGERGLRAPALSITAPAHRAKPFLQKVAPDAGELLEKIYYPPVASVTLAYPTSALKPEAPGVSETGKLQGFGHLIPRKAAAKAGVRTLGTIWSSSLFPYRAPEGYEMLLCYIGGSRDVAIGKMDEEEIYKQCDQDIRKVLLKDGWDGEVKKLGIRVWPTAIPQYEKGHLDVLENIQKNCPSGLFLGGNYKTGVAFGDCVDFGIQEAKKISSYLKKKVAAIPAGELATAKAGKVATAA
uniref:Protoporphyrinogen oxidase n=1 Tax=Amorphochlora amoebiformis TaxID=1561963 RepID=A0A7S0H584_9EUKA